MSISSTIRARKSNRSTSRSNIISAATAMERGSKDQDATLSSLPAGKYTLRVEGTWQDWQKPMPISLKVEQNVNRGVNFLCAFVVLLIVPILGLFRKISFESRRWKDSMFSTSD